jgi:hypothetical protein
MGKNRAGMAGRETGYRWCEREGGDFLPFRRCCQQRAKMHQRRPLGFTRLSEPVESLLNRMSPVFGFPQRSQKLFVSLDAPS